MRDERIYVIIMGGFNLRHPSTIRLPGWVGARHSVLHIGARHQLLGPYLVRPNSVGSSMYSELGAILDTESAPVVPTFPANADLDSLLDPNNKCQSMLQAAMDSHMKNKLLTPLQTPGASLPAEDLIRLDSILHSDNHLHKSLGYVVDGARFGLFVDPLQPRFTEPSFCMAFARRFGFPSLLIPPLGTHSASCTAPAGINGAHAVCCQHSAGERSIRHDRFVKTLALCARRTGYEVHTNGPASSNSFEYSFGTDRQGHSTQDRSDLVIRDSRSGARYCLDVSFTDPAAQINQGANPPSTTGGLKRTHDAHVQTYGDLCAFHNITFVPMVFDTLGRAHVASARWLKTLFLGRPREVATWTTAKVLRVVSDGLHSASAVCALRSSGAPTRDCRWSFRGPSSRAVGA